MTYLARKRRDLPVPRIFWMFIAFTFACGTTHLIEVWMIWDPHYWLSGGLKAVTGIISVATAIALIGVMPQVLAFGGEDKFRGLLEAVPDAMVMAGRDGIIALVTARPKRCSATRVTNWSASRSRR
jgi:hypothetical protein